MVDIFDEVEEDLRAERAARLLKKYAWLIIVTAVAAIGAVIGWQLWSSHRAEQDMAAAQQYLSAQTMADSVTPQTRTDGLAALDKQAATAPEGYRTLSRFRAAGLKAGAGDVAGAVGLLEQVAADSSADSLLRDLATLQVAQLQLDHADPAQLEARLKPITEPANPWSTLAKEQLALLDLRQGRVADSKTALKALSVDILAPAGLRQRAAAILSGLGG